MRARHGCTQRGYALPLVFLVLMLLTIGYFSLLDTVHSAALATGLHLDRRHNYYACDGVVRMARGQLTALYDDNFDVSDSELAEAMDPIHDLAHQYGIDVAPPMPPTNETTTTIASGDLAGMEMLESASTMAITSDPVTGCGWNLAQPLGKLSPLQFMAFSVAGGRVGSSSSIALRSGFFGFTWGRAPLQGFSTSGARSTDSDGAPLRFPAPPSGTVANDARNFLPYITAPSSAADGLPTTERTSTRAFYAADLRIIDGVWYLRDPAAPTTRGIPLFGDHVCADLANPEPSCAAIQTATSTASNRHRLYSSYERYLDTGLSANQGGVVSYGHLIGGVGPADIVTATSRLIDGRLPLNFNVGLFVQAMLTQSGDEIGANLCPRPNTCPRIFNGQVYITSTTGLPADGALVPDALCGQNGTESAIDGGRTGSTPTIACGTGAKYDAVRLYGGRDLRELNGIGLTISSDLPVYIQGDWNRQNHSPPTLIMAPRVTLLSDEWRDDGSGVADGKIDVTGSIISGVTATSPFSGAPFTDLLRTIEDGVEVEWNGSIVLGFSSTIQTDTRGFGSLDWSHPDELKSPTAIAQPPGVPRLGVPLPATTSPFNRFGGGGD